MSMPKNNNTIEILSTKREKANHQLTVFCLENNRVCIKECHDNEFKMNIQPYLTRHPGTACEKLIKEYRYSGSLYDGFHEYSNIDKVIEKLWPKVTGQTFEGAIAYLNEHIIEYSNKGWKPRKEQPEPPELGVIVGKELLPMRRYTGNDNKKTFDIVDMQFLTTQMSAEKLKDWFKHNRDRMVELAYAELENNKSYLKYGVPANYLKLDHVGLGRNTIRMTFVLKEKSSENL